MWLSCIAIGGCAQGPPQQRVAGLRSGGEGPRRLLERDLSTAARIMGPIDLARAAGAERAGDAVRSEAGTGLDLHDRIAIQCPASGTNRVPR